MTDSISGLPKDGKASRGVAQILRKAGLRPTRQRLALGALLFEGEDRHVTAESLHAEAAGVGHHVSLATVYNTLHQFKRAGLLRELAINGAKAYFDTNTSNHNHFFVEDEGELRRHPWPRHPRRRRARAARGHEHHAHRCRGTPGGQEGLSGPATFRAYLMTSPS